MTRILRNLPALLLAVASTLAPVVHGQTSPDRPVQLVTAGPPGGGSDAITRQLAQALSAGLKQPVLVANKPGGDSIIANEFVAKAPPDGHTLLVGTSGHPIHHYLHRKLPYDAQRDFAPVAKVASAPFFLVASGATNVRTVSEFRQFVLRHPEKVSFAVSDPTTRMATEMFLAAAQVKHAVQVTFKGTGPGMNDIAAGHVSFFMVPAAAALPFRGTGRMHFVGVAGASRSSLFPEVPTLAEQGVPIDAEIWYCLLAPARTPEAILDRLAAEIQAALGQPDMVSRLRSQSMEPSFLARREFTTFFGNEFLRFGSVIKAARIEPQ